MAGCPDPAHHLAQHSAKEQQEDQLSDENCCRMVASHGRLARLGSDLVRMFRIRLSQDVSNQGYELPLRQRTSKHTTVGFHSNAKANRCS
jgi:hypothetical protein